MSTSIDWPRISIESQRPIGSGTKHYARRAGTSDTGLILWNNLALAASGTVAVASARPYVPASSQRFEFEADSWLVKAVPDDNDTALFISSGTLPPTKPYEACSWYAPNFTSWLIDTVADSIVAGQQSSATTIPCNVSLLGTGAEWFEPFYAAVSVRAERAAMTKEPVRIDEFVAHGTAMRAVADHFLKDTRDLTQKERSFLARFYSRARKKGK